MMEEWKMEKTSNCWLLVSYQRLEEVSSRYQATENLKEYVPTLELMM